MSLNLQYPDDPNDEMNLGNNTTPSADVLALAQATDAAQATDVEALARAANDASAFIASTFSVSSRGLVGATGGGSVQGGSVLGLRSASLLDDAHRVLVEGGGGLALVRWLLAVADKRENRQGALAAAALNGGILMQLQEALSKLSIHVASVEMQERLARPRDKRRRRERRANSGIRQQHLDGIRLAVAHGKDYKVKAVLQGEERHAPGVLHERRGHLEAATADERLERLGDTCRRVEPLSIFEQQRDKHKATAPQGRRRLIDKLWRRTRIASGGDGDKHQESVKRLPNFHRRWTHGAVLQEHLDEIEHVLHMVRCIRRDEQIERILERQLAAHHDHRRARLLLAWVRVVIDTKVMLHRRPRRLWHVARGECIVLDALHVARTQAPVDKLLGDLDASLAFLLRPLLLTTTSVVATRRRSRRRTRRPLRNRLGAEARHTRRLILVRLLVRLGLHNTLLLARRWCHGSR